MSRLHYFIYALLILCLTTWLNLSSVHSHAGGFYVGSSYGRPAGTGSWGGGGHK